MKEPSTKVVVHSYQIGDSPFPALNIGVPKNETRPAMWLTVAPGRHVLLALFHGHDHANTTVSFVDAMFEQINRAIAFYQHPPQGDENAETQGD